MAGPVEEDRGRSRGVDKRGEHGPAGFPIRDSVTAGDRTGDANVYFRRMNKGGMNKPQTPGKKAFQRVKRPGPLNGGVRGYEARTGPIR